MLEPPVVREFRVVAENVQSQNPGMEEPTAVAKCSELDLVTLDLVVQVTFQLSETVSIFC